MKSQAGLTLSLLKQGADPIQILVKLALRKALLGCETVLDVGCGSSPTLRQLGVSRCMGIEGYRPAFEDAKRQNTQDDIIHGDVREIASHFKSGQFDACIAMDVIEHLSVADGLKLMHHMELIAKKKVVFFTPNGFLPQKQSADSDLQAHLSGWETEEMRRHGYDVVGMLGPKKLRGEYHRLKRWPAAFWGLISFVDQIVRIHRQPEKAAAIFCIKTLCN
ncbi:MAG: class I SAM-dependent methyltransferase [Limisphaerales bacterium]